MISTPQQKEIIKIISPYNPDKIGIFGSYARGDNSLTSDIDILASFTKSPNLLELIQMQNDISESLNLKIDLITEKSINPKLKPYIEEDLTWIYE